MSQTAAITRITWSGLYLDFANPANHPIAPDSLSWRILIDADSISGGEHFPIASPLYDVTVPAAAVSTTFLGITDDVGPITNVPEFSLDLPTPFVAQAGVRYQLSPIALQPSPLQTVWGCQGAAGESGISRQYLFVPGSGNPFVDQFFATRTDRAFELAAVPSRAVWSWPAWAWLGLRGMLDRGGLGPGRRTRGKPCHN